MHKAVAALALAGIALAGCKAVGRQLSFPAAQISMLPGAWTIEHSHGVPAQPAAWGSGWYFDFPGQTGSVHYVTTPVHGRLPGGALHVSGRSP